MVTFTLSISLDAAPGLYEIQTFDYPGNGYSDENLEDRDFDGQAAIKVQVVPEPSTAGLLGVIAAGVLGMRAWRKHKAA